jgi:hypothetical protein
MENSLTSINNEIQKHSLNDKELALAQLNSITKKLPVELSNLIESAFIHNRIPKEYLFSSILFAFSNAAGLAFSIEALGYKNYGNLYFAIIGNRGDVKSAAMKLATDIFNEYDSESYKNDNNDELSNIKKKKFLINNATIQAAIYSHYHNKFSLGIFIDELTTLIKKMSSNKNSDGAEWRALFLEGYNNNVIDLLRKTTESFRIEKSYPTLMGSIQEQFVPTLFANGNLESGFIDRFLFTTKLTSNSKITRDKIPLNFTSNYNSLLKNVIEFRKSNEDNFEEITLEFENDSEELLLQYVQKLVNNQVSESNNIKEYLSKLQISIHKLIIMVHLIKNAKYNTFRSKINSKTLNLAIEINEFYFTNFKIINSLNNVKDSEPLDIDKIIELAIKNNASQKDIIAVTGKSKATISRKWNANLNNMKLETKA